MEIFSEFLSTRFSLSQLIMWMGRLPPKLQCLLLSHAHLTLHLPLNSAQTIARSPPPVPVVSPPQTPVRSPAQSPASTPSQSNLRFSPSAEQENDTGSQPSSPPGCRSLPEGRDNDSQASCESSNMVPASPTSSHTGSQPPWVSWYSPTHGCCSIFYINSFTSGNLLNSPVDLPAEAAYVTDTNGKINIHVSVTINAGTLAGPEKAESIDP